MDGDLIAAGRDADILELGTDRVVRRVRDGRSIGWEAELMSYLGEAGYPVPRIYDVQAGGTEIVMQRLRGPSMLQLVLRKPWQLAAIARRLAQLHIQLGMIEAPAGLRRLADGGDRVVHQDLHPLNVIMTERGPVVIDWSNAAGGLPETDVAQTWVIMRSSELPGSRLQRAVAGAGRRRFLRELLDETGLRDAALSVMPAVIDTRLTDRNLTPGEAAYLRSWRAQLHS